MNEVVRDAPFGVYVDQVEDGCIYANDALLARFGATWEEFAGFGWARSVAPAEVPGLRAAIEEYEHTLEPIFVRYRVRRPDGEARWIHARVHAMVGPDGRHVGSVGVTEDITEQRRGLERVAEGRKLEAIGRLSARVAHDLNNRLGVMLMAKELLVREAHSDRSRRHLDGVDHAIDQARRLTHQLLTLSRRRHPRRQACRLTVELKRLEPLLERSIGEGIALDVDCDDEDVHVPLDPGQLGQIVLNLATNGRDAMAGTGRLRLRWRRDGRMARIMVEDDGAGMSEETATNAFEPFFTTKDPGRGTGLGLATVRDIVTVVGGETWLDSTPGGGTRTPKIADDREQRRTSSSRHHEEPPMAHDILDITSVHPTRGYSHAARTGNLLFVAGQIAQDREGNLVGRGDVEAQAHQIYANLRSVLDEAGGDLSNIVKMTTYLTHAGFVETYRSVRNGYFTDPMPPNTLVICESLASPDFLMEVEAIAALD